MARDPRLILRAALMDWAGWHRRSPNAYPPMDTIARLKMPTISAPPQSKPPRGVTDAPVWVSEIDRAMYRLSAASRRNREAIGVVRVVYLRPRNTRLQQVAQALGMGMRTLQMQRDVGEALLEGWIYRGDAIRLDA